MTKKDIDSYLEIKQKFVALKENVIFLRSKCEYHSPIATGEIKGTVKNDYYTELADKAIKLKKIEKTYVFETRKMLDLINNIDDKVTRQVLKCKLLKGLTWEEMSNELFYSPFYLKKKYYTFVKNVD